jgi:hypothetical protein
MIAEASEEPKPRWSVQGCILNLRLLQRSERVQSKKKKKKGPFRNKVFVSLTCHGSPKSI